MLLSKKPDLVKKLEFAKEVINDIVYAVEQIGKMKDLDGKAKKEMAVKMAKEILAEYNIQVSDTWLELAIEAAVFFLNMTVKE
jgi:hypothetical protein